MDDGKDLLNTWTEIARYLDRGVRTVQRWEVELGLPVRRRGKERGAVIAIGAEIDEWLRACPIAARDGIPGETEVATKDTNRDTTHHPPGNGKAVTQISDQILEARRLRATLEATLESLQREVSKATGCLSEAYKQLQPATSIGSSELGEVPARTAPARSQRPCRIRYRLKMTIKSSPTS